MVRRIEGNIENVKEKINNLIGESVNMQITRGRKKAQKISGVVESVYPQVFVVNIISGAEGVSKFSCAYTDVLCGNVSVDKVDRIS